MYTEALALGIQVNATLSCYLSNDYKDCGEIDFYD